MALRTLIAPDDCVEQYEAAAGEHQEAGLLLMANGSAQGIAMMALSAEMLLKAAYFRAIGYAPTRTVVISADLPDARVDIISLGVPQPQGQAYHSLEFWAEGLIALRQQGLPSRTHHGRVYATVAAQSMTGTDEIHLRQCVARLATNWEIGDRYRSLTPFANKKDMEDVFDDAVEIMHLYDQGKV